MDLSELIVVATSNDMTDFAHTSLTKDDQASSMQPNDRTSLIYFLHYSAIGSLT